MAGVNLFHGFGRPAASLAKKRPGADAGKATIQLSEVACSPFSRLPTELLALIIEYLPATEILRIAGTSRAIHAAASDPNLWFTLYLCDFDVAPSFHGLLARAPKSCYKERLLQNRRSALAAAQRRREAAALKEANIQQLQLGAQLNAVHVVGFLLAPFILLLVWLALVLQRLDADDAAGSSGAGRPWAAVFVPLWLCVGLLLAAVAVHALAVCKSGAPPLSAWANVEEKLTWSPVLLLKTLIPDKSRAIVLIAAVGLLTLLCFATVVMKLDHVGENTYNWGMALLPLWTLFSLVGCILCGRWVARSIRKRACASPPLFSICCFLPLLATAVTLAVSLDSPSGIALHWVLMPLWVVLGLLGLCMVAGAVQTCCRGCNPNELDEQTVAAYCAYTCAALVFFVLPVLFLVLLCARVDGALPQLSWTRIGAPMLTVLTVASAASLILCLVASRDLVCGPLAEAATLRATMHDPEEEPVLEPEEEQLPPRGAAARRDLHHAAWFDLPVGPGRGIGPEPWGAVSDESGLRGLRVLYGLDDEAPPHPMLWRTHSDVPQRRPSMGRRMEHLIAELETGRRRHPLWGEDRGEDTPFELRVHDQTELSLRDML